YWAEHSDRPADKAGPLKDGRRWDRGRAGPGQAPGEEREGRAMFEKLVVPLDGSDLAEAVLPIAGDLAKRLGATLVLVQAIDAMSQRVSAASSMDPAGGGIGAEAIEEAIDAEKSGAAQYLERMQAQLMAQGLACESYVGDGAPAEVIIETAKE